jgi:UDP-N-acetylglucosamine:LPS N-acetylglucosamine transferase
MRVLIVCSSGGHLVQLHNLKQWWGNSTIVNGVTFQKLDSQSLLAGESLTWAHQSTTRNLRNLARNLGLAWRLLRSYRPDLVVSSGAGVAFPFFLLARLFGRKTVYVEVYDRIDSATVTGRLCYPPSDLFLLQWEEQRHIYSKSIVIGSLL